MFDSKKMRKFVDLSVLVGMLSAVPSDHETGPRGNDNVNSRSILSSIARRTNTKSLSRKLNECYTCVTSAS